MMQTVEAPNDMVVIIRPSFMKLCDQDACRAALFNHLLYWIAQKAKGQPADKIRSGEPYWYGNMEEDIHEGLAGAWGISKICKELKTLVKMGLIGQRHNPANGWDRKYHYFFGEEQARVFKDLCEKQGINLLKAGLCPEVVHLLYLTNAFVISNEWIRYIQRIHSLDSTNGFVRYNEAITKVTTKESNKGGNAESPNVQSANADLPSSLADFSDEEMIAYLQAKGMAIAPTASPGNVPPSETSQDSRETHKPPLSSEERGKIIQMPTQAATPAKTEKPKRPKPAASTPVPEKPAIVLGEREQAVYDAWSKMPWFKGITPKLTETLASHCATLAKCGILPTSEDMLKTRNWHDQQHPERRGRGYELGNFVHDYPKYLSTQYQSPPPDPSTLPAPERKRNPLGNNLNGINKRLPKVASKKVAVGVS